MTCLVKHGELSLKQLPGLNELSDIDIVSMINKAFSTTIVLLYSELYINDEAYFTIAPEVQLTKKWMIRTRGTEKTELKFKTANAINKLNLRKNEKALLAIFLLTTVNKEGGHKFLLFKFMNTFYYNLFLF